MIKDIDDTELNEKNKKKSNLLGKKQKKISSKTEDKLLKKLNNLNVNKENIANKDDSSESNKDELSDYESEEIYESCSDVSEDYIEDNYENHVNKNYNSKVRFDSNKNVNEYSNSNKKNEINIWDENTHKPGIEDELVFDNSAYQMLHRSNVDWPCFSVDWIIPERLYPQPFKNFYNSTSTNPIYKDEFPYTCYFLAGAQTSEKNGLLYLMKWFNLQKTLYDEDPDKEADSESEGAEPLMENLCIKTKGNINRLKSMRNSYISAYWSDNATVELIDLRNNIQELEQLFSDDNYKINTKVINNNNKKKKVESNNPHIKSFRKKDEGFAIDWNNINPGVFAVGGYSNEIDIHIPVDENCSDYVSSNIVNKDNIYNLRSNIKCHKGGIEDLFFSPNNPNLLASSGNDKCINIWDLRLNNNSNNNVPSINVNNAHNSDVNCISWKISMGKDMLASGGDDSIVKIWDPRFMNNSMSVIADIQYHKSPITSLDFDPISPCQLAVTSEDHRLSIWDFSVEPDDNAVTYKDNNTNKEIPDQLVFLHQGQHNLKDVKFHPYYNEMLLSTAENGLNIFKPNFSEDENSIDDEFTFK